MARTLLTHPGTAHQGLEATHQAGRWVRGDRAARGAAREVRLAVGLVRVRARVRVRVGVRARARVRVRGVRVGVRARARVRVRVS